MNLLIKIGVISLKDLREALNEIAEIRTALKEKHPDIAINVEVELKQV